MFILVMDIKVCINAFEITDKMLKCLKTVRNYELRLHGMRMRWNKSIGATVNVPCHSVYIQWQVWDRDTKILAGKPLADLLRMAGTSPNMVHLRCDPLALDFVTEQTLLSPPFLCLTLVTTIFCCFTCTTNTLEPSACFLRYMDDSCTLSLSLCVALSLCHKGTFLT